MDKQKQILYEAIEIHERLGQSFQDGDLARLIKLVPELELALQAEPDDEVYAKAATALLRPFTSLNRLHEVAPYLRNACQRAQKPETKGWAVLALAQYHRFYDQLDVCIQLLEELDLSELSTELFVAHAYALGIALRNADRYTEARDVILRGVHTAKMFAYVRGHVLLLNALGGVDVFDHQYERALDSFELGLRICNQQVRDGSLKRALENNRSAALIGARLYEEAERVFSVLAKQSMALEAMDQYNYARGNLAVVWLVTGRFSRVLEERALLQHAFQDSNRHQGDVLNEMSVAIASALGDPQDISLLQPAIRSAKQRSHPQFVFLLELVWSTVHGFSSPLPACIPNMFLHESAWRLLHAQSRRESLDHDERVVLNGLEEALLQYNKESHSENTPLWIQEECRAFSLDQGQQWFDLQRHTTSRKILAVLARASPLPVAAWELLEAVWPDVIVKDTTALNRLYTAIHRLRKLGFDPYIRYTDDGYALHSFRLV